MRRGPHAWLLAKLDAFLTEEQRRLPPAELSRYRVLLGATLLLVLLNVTNLLSVPGFEPHERMARATVGLVAMCGYALVLVLVRRRRSPTVPALLLCSVLTAAFVLATLVLKDPRVVAHAATMLIPLLSVYLLGPRLGFVFTAIFCLNGVLLHPLFHSGFGRTGPLIARPELWMSNFIAASALLFGWTLNWLHSTARDEALRKLRENEGQLVSLIESTPDLIAAVDTQGQLITLNQAARVLVQRAFGRTFQPGDRVFEPSLAEVPPRWRERLERALGGQCETEALTLPLEGQEPITVELTLNAVRGVEGKVVGVTVFGRDITARTRAEERLSEMHRNLLDVSRQAGMAEIATGVLHNVGNTLNSVNVSASLVTERLQRLRVAGLVRTAELLREHGANLAAFLREDERGQRLPAYLLAATEELAQERDSLLKEMKALTESVEHIKAVVSMQQAHARLAGVVEEVAMGQLLDDALRLNAASFERQGIQVRREYIEVPPVLVDRHKLLQILLNLLSNARHALQESGRSDKCLTIRVARGEGERLCIAVSDNGVGIPPENLSRLFTQGFTTKRDGHGFGLHISALAAEELGGALTVSSEGRDQGATFTLELPLAGEGGG